MLGQKAALTASFSTVLRSARASLHLRDAVWTTSERAAPGVSTHVVRSSFIHLGRRNRRREPRTGSQLVGSAIADRFDVPPTYPGKPPGSPQMPLPCRPALDHKPPRRLPPRGQHLQPSRTRQLTKLRKASTFPTDEYHHQQLRIRRSALIARHSTQDDNTTARPRSFRAASEDAKGLTIWPVAQNILQKIQIRTGWQRFEETLAHGRNAVSHSGGPESSQLIATPVVGRSTSVPQA